MCKNCEKKGRGHKECRATVVTCFYCKEKEHKSFECPKAKKRDQTAATSSTATVVADRADNTVADSEETQCSAAVAAVGDWQQSRRIPISPILKIIELNGSQCVLKALVDTGSPTSFVKGSVFIKPNRLIERNVGSRSRRYNTLLNHT